MIQGVKVNNLIKKFLMLVMSIFLKYLEICFNWIIVLSNC